MKILILIFIKKIHYSLYIIIISLIKALSCFLALFHYFFINSFINEFNLMILLSFFKVLILQFYYFLFEVLIL